MEVFAEQAGAGFRSFSFTCYSQRCAYPEETNQYCRLRPAYRAENLFNSRPQGDDRR